MISIYLYLYNNNLLDNAIIYIRVWLASRASSARLGSFLALALTESTPAPGVVLSSQSLKPQRPALGVGLGSASASALLGRRPTRHCLEMATAGHAAALRLWFVGCACVPHGHRAAVDPSMHPLHRHSGSICIDGDTCFRRRLFQAFFSRYHPPPAAMALGFPQPAFSSRLQAY
jgi:hypothetical protein